MQKGQPFPNTGKSNILESLALMSWCAHSTHQDLDDYIRFDQATQNLFYDGLVDHKIHITLSSDDSKEDLYILLVNEHFELRIKSNKLPNALETIGILGYQGDYNGRSLKPFTENIKFYRFKDLLKYNDKEPGSLKTPSGANLFSVVFGSENLREIMKEFFQKYKLRLVLKPQDRIFELQKQVNDLIFNFSYRLTSDTLRRIIFYTVAIASNKDSVLVFEEPESNSFPYYTRYLGERIALDETNQFFIATHNPYLLSAIIEKSRKEDVQVFITYFKDFQTYIKPLTTNQLSELMEADPFFNIEHFIEENE